MTRRIFFIADIHARHSNVLHLSGRLFTNIQEMEKTIINNINKVVKAEDVLYLVGDTCLGKKEDWVSFLDSLSCKNIIVIMGNHDKWGSIPKDKVLGIFNQAILRFQNKLLLVSHYPYRVSFFRYIYLKYLRWDKLSTRQLNSLRSKKRPRDSGLWLLHGHTHQKTQLCSYHTRMLNVGVDANAYAPISGEEIISIIQRNENKIGA